MYELAPVLDAFCPLCPVHLCACQQMGCCFNKIPVQRKTLFAAYVIGVSAVTLYICSIVFLPCRGRGYCPWVTRLAITTIDTADEPEALIIDEVRHHDADGRVSAEHEEQVLESPLKT